MNNLTEDTKTQTSSKKENFKVTVEREKDEIIVTVEGNNDIDYCYVEYHKLSEAKRYDWEGQFSGILRFLTPFERQMVLRQITDGLHSFE